MAEITNVSKLIINYLTEEQYQTAKASDLINENELYIESAQRLLGVAHPTNHPPSIITQDANNRFMTDAEKTKLSGIATGANNYTHPANHPPSIITQDASNRFVTDLEKASWNGKANPPTAVTATLSTTWTGSGPYTQNVTVSGVTSTNNITVSLASTANKAQRNAARDALLSATAQATNRITVTADGDKPTVALPIQILILGG